MRLPLCAARCHSLIARLVFGTVILLRAEEPTAEPAENDHIRALIQRDENRPEETVANGSLADVGDRLAIKNAHR